MDIKVLGPGCTNCQTLAQHAADALSEIGIEATIEKITEISKFVDYNVFITPALVINGNLKVQGRVPTKEEIISWLKEETS